MGRSFNTRYKGSLLSGSGWGGWLGAVYQWKLGEGCEQGECWVMRVMGEAAVQRAVDVV